MGIINTILSGAKNTIGANPLGLAVGAGQMIAGAIQKKKAQGMSPAPVSPLDQAMYNRLLRRQQAISTGVAYNPQIVAGQQTAKLLAKNALNAGAVPNMGLYNQALSQTMQNIQELTSRDIVQTNAQMMEQGSKIADVSRDLQLAKQTKMEANAAENRKAGFQNLAAAIMPSDQEYKYNELGETPEEARKRKREERRLQKEKESLNSEEETEEETEEKR